MRRVILFIATLLCTAAICPAQYRTPDYRELGYSETGRALREHVGYLASAALEGRAAGSEGEAEAADYVREVLAAYGVDLLSGPEGDVFGIKRYQGPHYRRTALHTYLQRGQRQCFGCRHDA